MPTLLVIDDDPLILDCFRFLFPQGQAAVLTAVSAAEGLNLFTRQRPDVVVLDVRLPDLSGLEAFRRFHALDAKVPIILMTGHGNAETAIDAMRLGACDYVVKPFDPEPLREIIARAFEINRLMRVPAKVADQETADEESDLLVGNCPAMQEVYKAIGRVASQDVTVLILGESGTGKELVARAIYHYSNRSRGKFLAINCAAIPEALLESELFGHEKGSFTGAERKRIGKFEQCDRGTLFLDEIGDMPLSTQSKILRVLQDRQFERVGGNATINADVRIIAATNQNLEAMVAARQFRHDLYYRLNVFTITLPPLRDRGEDIPLLARHFLHRFSRELSKEIRSITPEALELLRCYSWPGNVRELQSVLKQTIIRASGPVVIPQFLPLPVGDKEAQPAIEAASAEKSSFPDVRRFIQSRLQAGATGLHAELQALTDRLLILQVLAHTNKNLTQAARILGITRATLRSKLGLFGITIERALTVDEEDEPS